MRKIALICLSILGTFSLAQAQTIVPRIGATIATTTMESTSPNSSSEITSQSGFVVGVGYNVPVTSFGKFMLSLQPELTYLQKGFKIGTSGEFQIDEAYYQVRGQNEFTINYFEIPVLAKVERGSDNFKVAVFAGPSLGFGLGGKFKGYSRTIGENAQVQEYKFDGDIVFYRPEANSGDSEFDHNIDFGIQAGASVTIFKYVSVDVRYGLGLTDLNHDDESKNRVLQFSVGVPIRIK